MQHTEKELKAASKYASEEQINMLYASRYTSLFESHLAGQTYAKDSMCNDFKDNHVNYILVNALRFLDIGQLKRLRDNLNDRVDRASITNIEEEIENIIKHHTYIDNEYGQTCLPSDPGDFIPALARLIHFNNTQWIRVDSGELPERGERVLCLWHPLAQMKHDVTIDDLIDENGFRRAAVIAWCRIPNRHTDLDNVTLVKG